MRNPNCLEVVEPLDLHSAVQLNEKRKQLVFLSDYLTQSEITLLKILSVSSGWCSISVISAVIEACIDSDALNSMLKRLSSYSLIKTKDCEVTIESERLKHTLYASLNREERTKYHELFYSNLPSEKSLSKAYHLINRSERQEDRNDDAIYYFSRGFESEFSSMDEASLRDVADHCLTSLKNGYKDERKSLRISAINRLSDYFAWANDIRSLRDLYDFSMIKIGDRLEDTAYVANQLLKHMNAQQQYDRSVDIGLKWLAQYGIHLKPHPTRVHVIIEYLYTRIALTYSKWHSQVKPDYCNDARAMAITSVMGNIGSASYISRPLLFPILAFKGLRMAKRQGVCAEHGFALAAYAYMSLELRLRKKSFGKSLDSAERFIRISRTITKNYDNRYSYRVDLIEYGIIRNWREGYLDNVDFLYRTLSSKSSAEKDPEYAIYCGAVAVCLQIARGDKLSRTLNLSEATLEAAKRYNQRSSRKVILVCRNFALFLSEGVQEGCGNAPDLFADDWLSEILMDDGEEDHTLAIVYLVLRLFLLVIDGNVEVALPILDSANKYIDGVRGQQLVVLFRFLEVYVLISSASESDRLVNEKMKRRAYKAIKQFELWGQESLINFGHYFQFLEALYEIKLNGRQIQFSKIREAVHLAIQSDAPHMAALYCDKSFQLCIRAGRDREARESLDLARKYYLSWGANSKARFLEARIRALYEQTGVEKDV